MKKKTEYFVKKPMHAPVHPGLILKSQVMEALGLSVTEAAQKLAIDRTTLSRLMNGRAAVSVDMALRLAKALGTSPDLWLRLQQSYDLWQARQSRTLDLSRIKPLKWDAAEAFA